jgi:hypothetical protein
MSESARKIIDWQHRFYAGEPIWAVLDDENIGNYYTTKEAAEVEVAWRKARPQLGRCRLQRVHLHTPELSRERWSEEFGQ